MALTNSIPRQYDPAKVVLLLGDVAPTDVAPDTMYVISKEEDTIMPTVGVLGEVALSRNRNNLGTLTISLKQTSPMNQIFMKWMTTSYVSGVHFFPVDLTDPASGIVMSTTGWIQTQPDFTLGKEVSQLDWVIGLANVEFEISTGANLVAEAINAAASVL
jgi:hypothetical protein